MKFERSDLPAAGQKRRSWFSNWRRRRSVLQERADLLLDCEKSHLVWFWSADANEQIVYISEPAAASLGYASEELVGASLSQLVDVKSALIGDESSEISSSRSLEFLLRARQTFTQKEVLARRQGKELWWSLSGRPQFDDAGDFSGYRGNIVDVTKVRKEREDTKRLSQFDALTGLANRSRMNSRLHILLTGYKAVSRSCALMMLDLDRFKHVNDTLGHPTGDELLRLVAQRLKRVVGEAGEIGRLGGDEFQIFVPDQADRNALGKLARNIIQMLSQPYLINGNSCVIGASVGIAVAPDDGYDVNELVRKADLSLYAAKESGRGQHQFYTSDLHSRAEERRQIESELRKAIHRGELELHYQAIACPRKHRVKGFEALLRWNHPVRGFVDPELVVSVAEETGLIVTLGEWVIRQACDDAAHWPQDIRVSVNVSPVQFATENFASVVASALANSGIRPDKLELEVTETIFLDDKEGTQRRLKSLKDLGVRFALDDFGTGYSSLGYLRDRSFSKIKIDQSFIRGALDGTVPNNAAIIAAIAGLAKALDMETTAEGIEAMDELEFIKQHGVTTVQGHIYSKAVNQAEVMHLIKDQKIILKPSGPKKTRAKRRSMLRKIAIEWDGKLYDAKMRDISDTGAKVQGIPDIPVGTELSVVLGKNQSIHAVVRRTGKDWQGVEFREPLVIRSRPKPKTKRGHQITASNVSQPSELEGNAPLKRRA